MYDQIREDIFFIMLYGAAAMLSLAACCYLLFRRSNAFAPDIAPPVRLRRWTAACFASMFLSHVHWQEAELHYVNRHEGSVQHCCNCDTVFADNFCPRCGQRAGVGRVG